MSKCTLCGKKIANDRKFCSMYHFGIWITSGKKPKRAPQETAFFRSLDIKEKALHDKLDSQVSPMDKRYSFPRISMVERRSVKATVLRSTRSGGAEEQFPT